MGFAPDQLRDKALAALEEVAEQTKSRPLLRTKALAFSLAYLWAYRGGERWPFVTFWQAVAFENDIGRSQGVNASLNAIYLALGVPRERLHQRQLRASSSLRLESGEEGCEPADHRN